MGPTSASHESSEPASTGARRVGSFVIGEPIGAAFGLEFFRATSDSGDPLEVIAVAAGLVDANAQQALGESIAAAAAVRIDGLSVPIALEGDGKRVFVAATASGGGPLSALLARKKATGSGGFAPRAAGNLVGRLCAIAGALHQRGLVHGAINLETVRVDKAGGVHLAGLGLAPIVPRLARAAPTHGTAPELANGAAASVSSDLYAIGAILYEVLVGSPPARGCARPSEVVAELSGDVDKVVAAAMHPSVDRRPPSAEAFASVLAAALAGRSVAPQQNSGGAAGPASAPSPSLAESLAPSASGQLQNQQARTSGQISAALSADDEAWLISKDRLDHGPFSMAIVLEMIRKDEILPGHIIINKHTGERAPVEEHPALAELVDEAKAARDERRRAQAEVVHSKTEKRRGVVLYGFIAAAVVGLAGGAYLIVNKLSADKSERNSAIGSLEEGELQVAISFPTRDKKASGGKRSGKRSGGKRTSGAAGGDEGWDETVDLGDASEGGGDERLDDSQINPVIQGASGRLGGCLSRNGGGTAAIKFIVKGSGKASYVAVNGKTDTGLAKCIGSVVRGLKFPSFDGSRTRANFTMSF